MLWIAMTLSLACTAVDVTPQGLTERPYRLSDSAYDALNPKGRRRAPSAVTMNEDRHLSDSSRRQLIGGVRSLRRNSSLLEYMVRLHLNYVTAATFQSRTGDKVFDREAEALMAEESKPKNCEYRGMLSLDRVIRLAESHAVLDGDVGVMLIGTDTGRVQGIEGDRIRNPVAAIDGYRGDDWYNGVHVTADGVPFEYAVHKRMGGNSAFQFERLVSTDNLKLHSYLGRFDQYRGISPVASAYNQLQDLYEAESYALLKTKVASLFGIKFKRGPGPALGEVTYETDEDGNPVKTSYQVDFGAGAPFALDLDVGDDAEFMSNNDPGGNVQAFWEFVTAIAFAALDLPYSMWDPQQRGNFFGNKTNWLNYDRACEEKRAACVALRDEVTAFKYRLLIKQKQLTLPKGLTVAAKPWEWIPRKMPWWRPLEEVTAELKAIGGGLSNPYHACAESDQGDFEENVDLIAKAMKYAADAGVPLSYVVGEDLAKQAQAATDKRQSK
jgi:capsid protein